MPEYQNQPSRLPGIFRCADNGQRMIRGNAEGGILRQHAISDLTPTPGGYTPSHNPDGHPIEANPTLPPIAVHERPNKPIGG